MDQEETVEEVEVVTAETEIAEAPEPEASAPEAPPAEEPKFTQSQLDAILKNRLAREREKQQPQQATVSEDAEPAIPDLGDIYDDDYEEKRLAREEAIREHALWTQRQAARQREAQTAAERAAAESQQSLVSRAETYSERARKLEVSQDQLAQAGRMLQAYGVSNEVAELILDDEQGPLLTVHFAQHPEDLLSMQALNPVQQGVYLATTVRPKLSSVRGATPPPADIPEGGAAPAREGPPGAKFW